MNANNMRKKRKIKLEFGGTATFYPCGCRCVGIKNDYGEEVVVTGKDIEAMYIGNMPDDAPFAFLRDEPDWYTVDDIIEDGD